MGVAHVPEDRQRDGLVLSYPVADNMVLNTYYLPPFATGIVPARERRSSPPPRSAWTSSTSARPAFRRSPPRSPAATSRR